MNEKITLERIRELQKQYGVAELQMLINSGLVWLSDKTNVRIAKESLESGMCMLPKESYPDENGVLLPSRDKIYGTQGSLEHSQIFWQKVEDGLIKLEKPL
jgi:hypothetical protein